MASPSDNNGFRLGFNTVVGLVMTIAFFVALFFVARGVFQLLSWVAPVLIVAALIINYRTVTGFLAYLWTLINRNPLMGILAIVLTVLGFPIVSGVLFGKAILDRKVRKMLEDQEPVEQFIEYEEVHDVEETLDLPNLDEERLSRPEQRGRESDADKG